MIIKTINKLPRLATIPGLELAAYRRLQAGQPVDAPDEAGSYLVLNKYAETAGMEEEKP